MIALAGSPEQIGRTWGEINAEQIREHYREFIAAANDRDIDDAVLLTRAGRAAEIIEDLAPHWGIEADAIAEAVDLPADLHMAYLIGKSRDILFLEPECTSYAAAGTATADRRPLFHKSRDNRRRWQAGYVKRQQLPADDVYAFVSISDVCDAGCMMMVNERGLAASADTGAKDEHPFGQGLMNPWVLRYLAERATDCHQALSLLEQMVAERFYAGGTVATNWMLADANGNVLRVVTFNDHVEHDMIQDGFLTTAEREGLRDLLEERSGRLSARTFRQASRLTAAGGDEGAAPVCKDSTISSLTVEIDPEAPEYTCAWVSLGRPDHAPYVPIYLTAERTPRAMVDGTLYQASLEASPQPDLLAELEDDFAARATAAVSEAQALESADDADAARLAVEEMTAGCVRDALEAMSAGR